MEQITYYLAIQTKFTSITSFFQQAPDKVLFQFFFSIGWMLIAAVFVWGVVQLWVFYCQIQYSLTLKNSLLAIDIPNNNELSPKSVENLFTYFGGAHKTYTLIEKYWLGMYQLAFSFEIVSIEGYTQFLIWGPTPYRDMMETAIYSQYPDAEITEVNDYTEEIPTKFPDDEYDIWGAEYIPANHWSLPIKTWRNFEHPTGRPEEQFKDPMAILMNLCASLGKGEQLWYQIIVYPTGFDWLEEGEKEISKIIGEKIVKKKNILDLFIDMLFGLLSGFSEMVYSFGTENKNEIKEDDNRFLMMNLKPGQKNQIEAIQEKISKLGFQCKIRFIYVAKKEVMNKLKVRNGFIGYMKQYMDLEKNNLKPDMDITATSSDYFFEQYFKNEKKIRLMAGYKSRSGTRGRKRFILNIEELATLWHFPIEAVVKAPLIQKAPGRKAEPPMELPVLSDKEIDSRLFDDKTVDSEDIFNDFSTDKSKDVKTEFSDKDYPKEEEVADDSDLFDIQNDEIFEKSSLKSISPMIKKVKSRTKGAPPSNLPFV